MDPSYGQIADGDVNLQPLQQPNTGNLTDEQRAAAALTSSISMENGQDNPLGLKRNATEDESFSRSITKKKSKLNSGLAGADESSGNDDSCDDFDYESDFDETESHTDSPQLQVGADVVRVVAEGQGDILNIPTIRPQLTLQVHNSNMPSTTPLQADSDASSFLEQLIEGTVPSESSLTSEAPVSQMQGAAQNTSYGLSSSVDITPSKSSLPLPTPKTEIKTEVEDYDYDIKEKLKEMGEISFETVKKSDLKLKPPKPDLTIENEVSVTPTSGPGKKPEDDASHNKAHMRRNIREVMDETKLDESTLAAQRQEAERLRRVQEQQRIIREMQRQMTQDRVISLLQGGSSSSGSNASRLAAQAQATGRVGSTVLVKLPNGQTKPMTKLQKRPFDLVRVPKGAIPPHAKPKPLMTTQPGHRPGGSGINLTPSVSIAPVQARRPSLASMYRRDSNVSFSDTESDEDDFEDTKSSINKSQTSATNSTTIDISSDDDCIVVSESDGVDEDEGDEDPSNCGMHTNDAFNKPDSEGRVVINVGHPEEEPDIYLAPQIARIIKPHQIGGIRFMYDNVVESITRFDTSTGFGCILAHSMGLGKTLQVVTFSDVFLRHTPAKWILCIMPINTLQNWLAEYNMWLPSEENASNSALKVHGEIRPRSFKILVLNDSQKTLVARHKIVKEWRSSGGVLLMGYEQYRLLALRKHPKSRSKKANSERAERDNEKARKQFDEIHEALVNPGPDLVICDEGHRIKNSHASISHALKQMKTKRRIVLTGYPLQNNLMEYWCMVDFVRPNYLGTKTEFCNMFERPIQNGQCIDSTEADIKLMRYRAHVLHSLLLGFVQRRSHTVLQAALPQKEEHVLLLRMTDFQRTLYETFMNEVVRTQSVPNPLKAFAVCCKIWNHPDVLYNYLKKNAVGEAVDLDIEEVRSVAAAAPIEVDVAMPTPKKKATPRKPKGKNADGKPAASIVPYNSEVNKPVVEANSDTAAENAATTILPVQNPEQQRHQQQQPYNASNDYQSTQNNFATPTYQNLTPVQPQQLQQNQYPQQQQHNNYGNYDQNYPNNQYPATGSGGFAQPSPQQNYPSYNSPYPHSYDSSSGYSSYNNSQGFSSEGYNPSGQYPDASQQQQQQYSNNANYWNTPPPSHQSQEQLTPQPAGTAQPFTTVKTENTAEYNYSNYNTTSTTEETPQYPPQNQTQPQQPQQQQQHDQPQPQQQQTDQQNWPKQEVEESKPNLETKPKINIISDIKISNAFEGAEKLEPKVEDIKEDAQTDIEDKSKIEATDTDVKDERTETKTDEKMDDDEDKDKDCLKIKGNTYEDSGIPYDWAIELLKDYVPGVIENSAKMDILFCIVRESLALNDRLLVFSQSLITLDLIEQFLQKNVIPGETEVHWAKNQSYYRLDGSTSALEREKLINEFNSNPKVYLFLVSTRAGSLGINLVGANRVVVLDASWNPCHDTQAVCRVYRYGQRKPCFVYRLVVDTCLEKKIYDRQINKQGMSDRIVDECNPDANLTLKDVSTLCWDDSKEVEEKDWSHTKDNYIDIVLQKVLMQHGKRFNKEPFQHESLLVDRKDKQLSQQEKRLAKRGYEKEKQAARQPQYGMSMVSRGIRPIASVRPMQQGGDRGSRWIPAEHWQRQGMTAQEMTLPLDVVIPTNQPDKGSIVLKAGQKVLVLKSPKGVYMQLESGKIVAIKTAIKVRGKVDEDGKTASGGAANTPATILKGSTSFAGLTSNLKQMGKFCITDPPTRATGVRPFNMAVGGAQQRMGGIRPNLASSRHANSGTALNIVDQIQRATKKIQLSKGRSYKVNTPDAPVNVSSSDDESESIGVDRRTNKYHAAHSESSDECTLPSDDESSSDIMRTTHRQLSTTGQQQARPFVRKQMSPLHTPQRMPLGGVCGTAIANNAQLHHHHHQQQQPQLQQQAQSQRPTAAAAVPAHNALQKLEQTTSSFMKEKQPFQESLNSITNSYQDDQNMRPHSQQSVHSNSSNSSHAPMTQSTSTNRGGVASGSTTPMSTSSGGGGGGSGSMRVDDSYPHYRAQQTQSQPQQHQQYPSSMPSSMPSNQHQHQHTSPSSSNPASQQQQYSQQHQHYQQQESPAATANNQYPQHHSGGNSVQSPYASNSTAMNQQGQHGYNYPTNQQSQSHSVHYNQQPPQQPQIGNVNSIHQQQQSQHQPQSQHHQGPQNAQLNVSNNSNPLAHHPHAHSSSTPLVHSPRGKYAHAQSQQQQHESYAADIEDEIDEQQRQQRNQIQNRIPPPSQSQQLKRQAAPPYNHETSASTNSTNTLPTPPAVVPVVAPPAAKPPPRRRKKPATPKAKQAAAAAAAAAAATASPQPAANTVTAATPASAVAPPTTPSGASVLPSPAAIAAASATANPTTTSTVPPPAPPPIDYHTTAYAAAAAANHPYGYGYGAPPYGAPPHHPHASQAYHPPHIHGGYGAPPPATQSAYDLGTYQPSPHHQYGYLYGAPPPPQAHAPPPTASVTANSHSGGHQQHMPLASPTPSSVAAPPPSGTPAAVPPSSASSIPAPTSSPYPPPPPHPHHAYYDPYATTHPPPPHPPHMYGGYGYGQQYAPPPPHPSHGAYHPGYPPAVAGGGGADYAPPVAATSAPPAGAPYYTG